MPDDVSIGELNRRLDAHERHNDRAFGELDSRLANLAKDMVPLALYQQVERDRDRTVQELRDEIKDIKNQRAMSFGKWMAVLTVVSAFLGVLVETLAALKGAK